MTLSTYHQKYAHRSDAEIQDRVDEKRSELSTIFDQVVLKAESDPVEIAVLGCGDKRYIGAHSAIFEEALGRAITLTTYDITTDHLQGEDAVVQHDCTLPLPGGPFDITYAHVLLRFIETDKQFDVLVNSYNSLKSGGLAIHILNTEDYETTEPTFANGQFSVPLNRWVAQLEERHIQCQQVPIKFGLALALLK